MDNQNGMNQGVPSNLASVISAMPAPEIPVETKKKVNVLAIVLGVVALVFAGLAVFFGVEYFMLKNGGGEPGGIGEGDGQGSSVADSTGVADGYKTVRNAVDKLTSDIENEWDYSENGSGLTYKPEGLNTYVPMKLHIQKKIKNSSTAEENVAALKSRLERAGYSSIGILPYLGSAGPEIYGYSDTRKGIVCGISVGDGDYAILECAKTDWAWLTEEEAELAVKLEAAYHDKTGEYPRLFRDLDVKAENSEISPYQVLRVSMGWAQGLFYRTSSDGDWQYFATAQGPLKCIEYNTDDLKNAFAGEVCYNDESEESVVQP